MRYLIDFSYSGALFNGYQKQPGLRTIQGEIEKVLTSINNSNSVIVYSAGRTDRLVNALHQHAHFDLDYDIKPDKLKMALNSYLPKDIYINNVKIVSSDFHARYMVKSKTYEYLINLGEYNPLLRSHVYQYCKNLDVQGITRAIEYFKGTHDFTSFVSAEDKRENKERTIYNTSVNFEKDILSIKFTGNGFLKYQIRNMVGALIKVGEGKLKPEEILNILEKKDRRQASICAPAEGLTLIHIEY